MPNGTIPVSCGAQSCTYNDKRRCRAPEIRVEREKTGSVRCVTYGYRDARHDSSVEFADESAVAYDHIFPLGTPEGASMNPIGYIGRSRKAEHEPRVNCSVKRCQHHNGDEACEANLLHVADPDNVLQQEALCDTFAPEGRP